MKMETENDNLVIAQKTVQDVSYTAFRKETSVSLNKGCLKGLLKFE